MAQTPEMGRKIEEMDVSSPTLRWISIDHPKTEIPIGEDDRVLESIFNLEYDTWELLVLVQPTEGDEESDETET